MSYPLLRPYVNNQLPNNPYVNERIFPHLGAFSGEVGNGLSPGGIGIVWRSNLPLNYFYNFGSKKKKISKKKKKISKKSKRSKRK